MILLLLLTGACADFREVVGGKSKSSADFASPKRKKFHIVQSGETLEQIADQYKVSVMALISVNELDDSPDLAAGQKIYLPQDVVVQKQTGKKHTQKISPSKPSSKKKDKKIIQKDTVPDKVEGTSFMWPVSGRMSSGFGVRRQRDHEGIDIVAPKGTIVLASKDGTVLFVGRLSSYGNLIILKHHDNYFTAYAHLSEIMVKKDQKIKVGQKIGKVGQTGRASAPHLHFEIRHKTVAEDPMKFLKGD